MYYYGFGLESRVSKGVVAGAAILVPRLRYSDKNQRDLVGFETMPAASNLGPREGRCTRQYRLDSTE